MRHTIDYLKSPQLVVKIQEYFGIQYVKTTGQEVSNENGRIKRSRETFESSDPHEDSSEHQKIKRNQLTVRINNKFWYYLFLIGTELGDEIFYATFIPFWFWNIDSAVGRRVTFIWAIIMYIGQGLKEIIKWPRPGKPVHQLQEKWSLEYGMPSTHAMGAVSIPFSVFIFTQQRYVYSFPMGLLAAILWCTVICLSRIYLGMHSVLDVLAGLLLTVVAMVILVPLADYLDFYIVTNIYSPVFVLLTSILLIYCYPQSKGQWMPTRGDTTMTISVCAGLQIGAWLNYQLGDLKGTPPLEPHEIIWPTYQMFGHLVLRTVFGMCCILATRAIVKTISYAMLCGILRTDREEARNSSCSEQNHIKTFIELSYKYLTYSMIGFNTHYLLPNVFKLIGIGRPDFYTEI